MFQNIITPFDFSIEIESLYIAYVFPNIHKKRIAQLFEKLSLARIAAIDLVPKIGKDGNQYNSAFIHIDYWFDNESAKHFQEKIRSDAKEALLVYDDPWYWIVNENTSKTFKTQMESSSSNILLLDEIEEIYTDSFLGTQKKARYVLNILFQLLQIVERSILLNQSTNSIEMCTLIEEMRKSLAESYERNNQQTKITLTEITKFMSNMEMLCEKQIQEQDKDKDKDKDKEQDQDQSLN